MKCPYCGKRAVRSKTDNQEVIARVIVLDTEGNDVYDNPWFYVCTNDQQHWFYTGQEGSLYANTE
jgi:hypothetical protein